MIRKEPKELTLFDKANAAARTAMQSVIDVARRTRTEIVVFRGGKITWLMPDQVQEESEGSDQTGRENP